MKFSAALAAIVLTGSAFVSAAPTAAPDTSVTVAEPIFARLAVCNPPKKTDKKEREEQLKTLDKMASFTRKAHTAEEKCPSSKLVRFDQIKKSQKTQAEQLKKDCISAYKECVTARKGANSACKKAGGVVDKGHLDAVAHCQDQGKKWTDKKV